MQPRVAIYKCESYEETAIAVEKAFEDFAIDVAGKKVFVKPNMLGPMPPESNVCTHPSVVREVIAALEKRGAAEVLVGDNSGMRGYGSNVQCAKATGLYEAAGGRFVNISDDPRRIETGSRFASEMVVSGEILDADVFISLPKMKTHVATGITGGLKNSYGILVGGQKTMLHRAARRHVNFAEVVLDAFAVRPPDFLIMDAVYGMEGQGPAGGKTRHIGRLLASTNAAAMDVVMAEMMGVSPEAVPMLCIANQRGLGPINTDEIDVEGPFYVLDDFKTPGIGMGLGTLASRLMGHLIITQPRADKTVCVRCEACAKICPVEAITMDPFPVIDKAKCISCFCCHELCKYAAMQTSRRMRFFQRASH